MNGTEDDRLLLEDPGLPEDVISWRLSRLVGAGYPEETAEILAELREVDLHRAVELLANGCPAELAWKILL